MKTPPGASAFRSSDPSGVGAAMPQGLVARSHPHRLPSRAASAITPPPAARLIQGCRGSGEVLSSTLISSRSPASRAQALGRRPEKESQMPKIKTKSGAKKRFKVTGTGKVLYAQRGKRHGMIKRTKKQIRQLRGTTVLFKTDGDNIKKYFLPNG
jgi:large subunit ribosomal protein L35